MFKGETPIHGQVVTPAEDYERLTRRSQYVCDALVKDGLFEPDFEPQWRVSPYPFRLSSHDAAFLESLGNHLLIFYRALNHLYFESVRGEQPAWVACYMDQGKPSDLIAFGRMKRFRQVLPDVIRPDIIPTETGLCITELDSVPGGIGTTGSLSQAYAKLGDQILGGEDGMIRAFARMVRKWMGTHAGCVAIVVSDEAEDYRAEMTWVASQLTSLSVETYCVHPREIRFSEEGLFLSQSGAERPISLVYRFFELFDLKNIPKSELVMYAAKKGRTIVTPPYKPWLEEKLGFALLHHPILEPFWAKVMGNETFDLLLRLMPRTWVLDPHPLPPTAVIPHLHIDGHAVSDWNDLVYATQRQRSFVVKPSGFSELAWGGRGVSIGHDLPQTEWATTLQRALEAFSSTPYILQDFHKGRKFDVQYHDFAKTECVPMSGRVRLSPYYFVEGDQAKLGGILATICPKDKKIIHGMRDAIMVPCSLATDEKAPVTVF